MNELSKKIKGVLCEISPKLATQVMYFYNFRKLLNLRHPQDINEKMQYLKLYTYYENPVVTQCVDKFQVRKYLTKKGHECLEDRLITAQNKWLIGHAEGGLPEGSHIGLIGKNVDCRE